MNIIKVQLFLCARTHRHTHEKRMFWWKPSGKMPPDSLATKRPFISAGSLMVLDSLHQQISVSAGSLLCLASDCYSSITGTSSTVKASARPFSPASALLARFRSPQRRCSRRRPIFPPNLGNWNQLDEESLYIETGAISKHEISLLCSI